MTVRSPPGWSARLGESLEMQTGPRRILAVSTLVNTLGNGLDVTAGALYFIRLVGLAAARVGAGLTIAGFVALAAGIPTGRMADRLGARRIWAVSLLVEACAMPASCLIALSGVLTIQGARSEHHWLRIYARVIRLVRTRPGG